MVDQPRSTIPPGGSGGAVGPNDRLLAAVGYPVWIVALIVLLMDGPKDRPFTRFHAIQALGYNVAAIVFVFIVFMLSICVGQVAWILGCITWMLVVVPFLVALYFAYLVYTRAEYFTIPVITDLLEQQGWIRKR